MPRVVEVALFTSDVEGSTAFYERLLGKAPDSSSPSHASFDVGGTTVFIHVVADEAHEDVPKADHIALALDQEEAARRVRSAGTEVVGLRTTTGGARSMFATPTVA